MPFLIEIVFMASYGKVFASDYIINVK